jgi:hypothetical protein
LAILVQRHIGNDAMGVQMGFKIAAGVMLKYGGDHLACGDEVVDLLAGS